VHARTRKGTWRNSRESTIKCGESRANARVLGKRIKRVKSARAGVESHVQVEPLEARWLARGQVMSQREHDEVDDVLDVDLITHGVSIGLDGWKCGRVDVWTCGRVDGWTGGRVDEWTSGRVDEWTSGQVDRWTGG
jgi:hypothetical protein